MKVPDTIIDLVERFDRNLEAYKRGNYNETQLRREFIDPFFKALGWDVDNEGGLAEAYKDVVHEDAIRVGHAVKAPDYGFRIGGVRKFFLEAKKPSVDIKGDVHPAYQLRRYAWSAKLPLSILTDFEEFAVYDCRIKPAKTDRASTARVLYLTYKEYPGRWDEIAGIFSREAILKGSFDQYVESKRAKRGTAEVDRAFLQEIERWRDLLARNIALRNPGLGRRELNFAVQRTIDRVIFLRICEDRGIERYGRLMGLLNGAQVYARLFELFRQADDRYNSGLFHFRPERGRPDSGLDAVTPDLVVDDRALKEVLKHLYYPDSPYEFSVLPADILGQVYEQFLGKVIRLTPAHRAVVEEKPEVKKAGGVYYTPTYIVEYIVRRTAGRLLKGKRPGRRGASVGIKVLDPACGSGSFLLGAYQYLLEWYRDGYLGDGPGKWARGRNPRLYQGRGGEWRLTTPERKRILLDHIYGVDIDPQAVEVTKLSLLLKVLEGENEETIARQLSLFRERALPDLGSNIKCGNSLVDPNFYEGRQTSLLEDNEIYRINAFDWEAEFPEIMQAGGFDAVIGNPPYVRQEMLGELKAYLRRNYEVYHGIADLYAYFIERGVSLLKPGGIFCYIVANKWMRANYGKPLRRWMKGRRIEEIVDFGDLPVFQGVTTYPCILGIRKDSPSKAFHAVQVETLSFRSLESYVSEHRFRVDRESLDDGGWSLVDEKTWRLVEKIRRAGVPLGEYVNGRIYYGIKTGLNEAFVIDRETRDRLIAEDAGSAELIKPFLAGRDIKRYEPPRCSHYVILIPKGWAQAHQGDVTPWQCLQRAYPAIANHLADFEERAKRRYDQGDYWWELRACAYYKEFEKPKIIYPNICKRPEFTFDSNNMYTNQKCFIIITNDLYLLGWLNSSITFFLFRSILPKLRGDFYEPGYVFLKDFPIRSIDPSNPANRACHDRMVSLVERMLALHEQLAGAREPQTRTVLERRIEATDHEIDGLVYELYGLTEEEIRIVEEETGG